MSSKIHLLRLGNRGGGSEMRRSFRLGYRDVARRRRSEPLPHDLESIQTEDGPDARAGSVLDVEVQSALAQLPELHRAAVTLRYFEELDYATIEQTLGLSNGALRGILGRALGAMRRKLKPALASIN